MTRPLWILPGLIMLFGERRGSGLSAFTPACGHHTRLDQNGLVIVIIQGKVNGRRLRPRGCPTPLRQIGCPTEHAHDQNGLLGGGRVEAEQLGDAWPWRYQLT